MEFNMLPNEGNLSLHDIRTREFGALLPVTQSDNLIEYELDYDPSFRLTEVRSIEELHFAFTKK